jgi:hypothetical protein
MSRRRARGVLVLAAAAVASCDAGAPQHAPGVDAEVLSDGRPAAGDDGGEGCVLDGYACVDASDCCSAVCSCGHCGSAAACAIDTALCSSDDDCCSRFCDGGVCVGGPHAPLTDAADCSP